MTEGRTIGKMAVGERANILPSRILFTVPWMEKWLDPANVVYSAKGLGVEIERKTETEFVVRVKYGAGYPSFSDFTESELEEAGYIKVTNRNYHTVGYFKENL